MSQLSHFGPRKTRGPTRPLSAHRQAFHLHGICDLVAVQVPAEGLQPRGVWPWLSTCLNHVTITRSHTHNTHILYIYIINKNNKHNKPY